MANLLKETYCCCQFFTIRQGIFLIAVHCFLQATFGILVVITSAYINKNTTLNNTVVAANICFFPAGILLFGTTLYNNYKAARLSALFFTVISLLNFAAGLCYIIIYNDFKANSKLDKMFFWRNEDDWVNDGELPFTFWHVFAYSITGTHIFWWYYSFQLWKFANILKFSKELQEKDFDSGNKRRSSSF